MALKSFVLIIAILAVVTSISHASDPSPLQDFCVAVNDSMTTGLIHFQFNVGKTKAIAFAGLSSQNPGVITIANAVFGSDPQSMTMFLQKHSKLTRKLWITSNHNSGGITTKPV
ncbi:hypothetical protein HAX54_037507 [Datura stramonium]|uniref:Germin-like protein n=1 Tax=Datura stramonium TaxID=4076 RepID=A0ABS8SHC6_DATST|nr:hypothetical protein [Datura stramonium]